MTWNVNFSIHNDTPYNITVTHNTTGDLTTIPAGGDWTTTTDEVNNTNALKFWQQSNVWYMQGSCSFGPEAGVYVDRGWMAPNDQTITLTAIANGKQFIQTENGGETLLAWNEFTDGGGIQLTFKKI